MDEDAGCGAGEWRVKRRGESERCMERAALGSDKAREGLMSDAHSLLNAPSCSRYHVRLLLLLLTLTLLVQEARPKGVFDNMKNMFNVDALLPKSGRPDFDDNDERDNCRNEGSLVIIKSHTHGERKPVVRSAAMIIAAKSRVLYTSSIEQE